MTEQQKHDRGILIRDVVIFQIKLVLDGLKDVTFFWISLAAAGLDLVAPGDRRGKRFYAVLRSAEKFDRWLSLYGSLDGAENDPDGLFGRSRAGSDTLLGKLEKAVRGAEETEEPAAAR